MKLLHTLGFFFVFLSSDSANSSKQAEDLTVEPIPGTGLSTGTNYRLALKPFRNSGVVTWTESKDPVTQDHFVQIDADPDHQPKYKKGGPWFTDAQWVFLPSGVKGYYLLKNRRHWSAVATRSKKPREGEEAYYIILNTDPDVLTSKRGNHLWKVVKADSTKSQDYYQLKVKSVPKGSVTWSSEKYGDYSHYIEVDPSNSEKYADSADSTGDSWWEDTLFTITPSESSAGESGEGSQQSGNAGNFIFCV